MPEFDFGHFHVIDELGRGGMAMVYRALDTRTEETVALKILYPHLMSDDNTIKRFQREAKVSTRLKHKYIVPVIDFGEHERQIYIAMKYMPGNSLAELFVEPRSVPIKAIIRILGEVASALDYAHGHGVVHRDLKLQNILLDNERHAYLADFGIARLVDGTRLTATGQVAGTPMYMSPEQIRGKAVDFRSDIYSFSVMSYLLLTGFYPFTGEDSLAIIHKHVKEFPPSPTEVNPELPETINPVLLRGLMKDPADRYETTLDMVKALHRAVNTPDYHKTTTRIDIHAINPVDSVEIDAVQSSTDRVQSPVGSTSQSLQASSLQSDVGSGFITAQQTMQGNNSRMGIFAIGFGIIAVAAIAVPLIFLVLQGNNATEQANIAATNARLQLELQLTATDLGHEVSEEDDNEELEHAGGNDTEEDELRVQTQAAATPPPAITPTDAGFPGSNGQIVSVIGADMVTNPSKTGKFIQNVPNYTYVQIVGRTGINDYVDVALEDGTRGFVSVLMVETELEITALPITFVPEDGPPPNAGQNRPPPNTGDNDGNRPPQNNDGD